MAVATNLERLKATRKPPQPGDVFGLRISDRYMFGRLVTDQAFAGWSMPGAILIYIFRTSAEHLTAPDRSELATANLLVPPMMTNRLPWTHGYFQTLASPPFSEGEVLPVHCFRSFNGVYYDEWAKELPGPVEPCGDWGLHSYRTIDDEISDALGIPRAPEHG